MQIEFDFEAEVAVTPAMAGDLWPEIVAVSHDPETFAEDGEAVFQVAVTYEGDDDFGGGIDAFEAVAILVDGEKVAPALADFLEAQMRRQKADEMNEFAENWRFYTDLRQSDRYRACRQMVQASRGFSAERAMSATGGAA